MGCNTSQELRTTNEAADVNATTANGGNGGDGVDGAASAQIEGAATNDTKENGELNNDVEHSMKSLKSTSNHLKTNGDASSNQKSNGVSNNSASSTATTAAQQDDLGQTKLVNGVHNGIKEAQMQFNQDINNLSISDGQKFTYSQDDGNDDDEEKAATKIQAVFRGHQVRSTMKKSENNSSTTANNGNNANATEQNGAASASDPQPTKAELEAEFDPNDKELCEAASKIQATFRGHLQRKMVNKDTPDDEDIQEITKKVAEELDIDLTDPELNKAATKIQASFRGHKTRKDAQ